MTLLRLWNLERKRERRSSLPCRRACTGPNHPIHATKKSTSFIVNLSKAVSNHCHCLLHAYSRTTPDFLMTYFTSIDNLYTPSCSISHHVLPLLLLLLTRPASPSSRALTRATCPPTPPALFPPTFLNHHNGRVYISFHLHESSKICCQASMKDIFLHFYLHSQPSPSHSASLRSLPQRTMSFPTPANQRALRSRLKPMQGSALISPSAAR